MAFKMKGYSAFTKKTDPPKKNPPHPRIVEAMNKPILSPHVKEVHPPMPPRHEFTPPPDRTWDSRNDIRPQMKNIAKTPKIESVKLPRYKKKGKPRYLKNLMYKLTGNNKYLKK